MTDRPVFRYIATDRTESAEYEILLRATVGYVSVGTAREVDLGGRIGIRWEGRRRNDDGDYGPRIGGWYYSRAEVAEALAFDGASA